MAKLKTVTLQELYGNDALTIQSERYRQAVNAYKAHFGASRNQYRIFSAPGRVEICGNHNDCNNGKILSAAINLDTIAIVEPIEVNKIAIKSEGYDENGVWLDNSDVMPDEKNTPDALIRGIVSGFKRKGFKIGGFKAYTTSAVPIGAGIASSAAFEILVGVILSALYNEGRVDPVKMAQICRYAENIYYGKPCGLMDQMSAAIGGFVAIDFKNDGLPVVESIKPNLDSFAHYLCLIETTGEQSELEAEYDAITDEMGKVASYYGVKKLRQISREDIVLNINPLRQEVGDRAVLRALHYFSENDRVASMLYSLKEEHFDDFLYLVNESGDSSYKYLQNVYSNSNVENQELAIALNIAQLTLKRKGASRIHGRGFKGTILAFVPNDFIKRFRLQIERIFGVRSCHVLSVRQHGGVEVIVDSQISVT